LEGKIASDKILMEDTLRRHQKECNDSVEKVKQLKVSYLAEKEENIKLNAELQTLKLSYNTKNGTLINESLDDLDKENKQKKDTVEKSELLSIERGEFKCSRNLKDETNEYLQKQL
jgi:hypothetical protein